MHLSASATLSRRAPSIIVGTLLAALVGYWASVPTWLPYAVAIAVAGIALVVMATRDRQPRPKAPDHDDTGDSWLAHELAGRGSPAGSYTLGFFALVTIVLTGFRGAYALPAYSALALAAAWGFANARYPEEDSAEQ